MYLYIKSLCTDYGKAIISESRKTKKMSLVGFGFGLSLETHRKQFFKSVITLTKTKTKGKKNKKQLVLKPEKKCEDRGENVTLNVICQIFALFFFAFNKIANKNLANIQLS